MQTGLTTFMGLTNILTKPPAVNPGCVYLQYRRRTDGGAVRNLGFNLERGRRRRRRSDVTHLRA